MTKASFLEPPLSITRASTKSMQPLVSPPSGGACEGYQVSRCISFVDARLFVRRYPILGIGQECEKPTGKKQLNKKGLLS
jgi:hypothetical protein